MAARSSFAGAGIAIGLPVPPDHGAIMRTRAHDGNVAATFTKLGKSVDMVGPNTRDPRAKGDMMSPTRRLTTCTMIAVAAAAAFVLPSTAYAHGHRAHHRHAAKLPLVPAHLKPGYVGAPGFAGGPPGPVVPAFIDLGYGPVFPFGGWPKKL